MLRGKKVRGRRTSKPSFDILFGPGDLEVDILDNMRYTSSSLMKNSGKISKWLLSGKMSVWRQFKEGISFGNWDKASLIFSARIFPDFPQRVERGFLGYPDSCFIDCHHFLGLGFIFNVFMKRKFLLRYVKEFFNTVMQALLYFCARTFCWWDISVEFYVLSANYVTLCIISWCWIIVIYVFDVKCLSMEETGHLLKFPTNIMPAFGYTERATSNIMVRWSMVSALLSLDGVVNHANNKACVKNLVTICAV